MQNIVNVVDFLDMSDFFSNFCYIAKYCDQIKLLVGDVCTIHPIPVQSSQ